MTHPIAEVLRAAAEAFSDLNTFGVIQDIAEGSNIRSSRGHLACERIARICRAEMQRCLVDYDTATERAADLAEAGERGK